MFIPLDRIKQLLHLQQNTPPMLPDGLDPVIHLDDIRRQNLEMTPQGFLGGINVLNAAVPTPDGKQWSHSGHALFTQTGITHAVEIHTDDSTLQPYEIIQGDYAYTVPALFKLVQRGLLDFQVLLTAHRPELGPFREHMQYLSEITENEQLRTFQERIENWANPRHGGVSRILWIIGQANALLPLSNGEKRGLGGRTVAYRQGGSVLGALAHRRPPNFRVLQPNQVNGHSRFYQLEAVGLESIIEEKDYLIVEGMPFNFYRGGVVDSATFPILSSLGIDILLRLEFLDNSSKLWVTPLLRSSGSREELDNLYERLKDLGGWTRLRGRHQLAGYQAFFPGNPYLKPWYGRREVIGWSNTEPEEGPLGLLQLISSKLAPVGDPQGSFVFGRVGGKPYTSDPELMSSVLVSGPSKKTGKTGTVTVLAHQLNPHFFWIDLTAAPLDPVMAMAQRFGGTVWNPDLPDPESVIIAEGRKPSQKEVEELRKKHEEEDKKTVQVILREMLQTWQKKGQITGLPFVMHPAQNTDRYLNLVRIFLTELSAITKEWLLDTEQYVQLIINDFSMLHNRKTKGSSFQRQLAIDTAEAAVWYLNQGVNHGVKPTWILTHTSEDADSILERDVKSTFGMHLKGGLKGQADFHFLLQVPESGETLAHLNLRITDDEMLQHITRLTPSEAKELAAELNQHRRPVFGRNGSKERHDVRSGT